MYQLCDIVESLNETTSNTLYLCYKIAFKDFINYADLSKHLANTETFPESLCRKLARKSRSGMANLNSNFHFTQNTEKSGFSGFNGRFGDANVSNNDCFPFYNQRNSNLFPKNFAGSINVSNNVDGKTGNASVFPLSSFHDINKYINFEEPLVKKIDDSKIKSVKPKEEIEVNGVDGYDFKRHPKDYGDNKSKKDEDDGKSNGNYSEGLKMLYSKINTFK